jgi:peptidyl-prolyl cis-trans isomerase A (cyclophilin A)
MTRLFLVLLALGLVTSCKRSKLPAGGETLAAGKHYTARITTEKGTMTCALLADKAPETVANFVGLARGTREWTDPIGGGKMKRPFFDGLAWHRVIPGFMIQGGDPLSAQYERPELGAGGPGYEFENETSPDLTFDRPGRMAMANAGQDTNGSQIFITEMARPELDGKYSIFGQCAEASVEVVKAIARVPRDDSDKPRDKVTMKVEIIEQ